MKIIIIRYILGGSKGQSPTEVSCTTLPTPPTPSLYPPPPTWIFASIGSGMYLVHVRRFSRGYGGCYGGCTKIQSGVRGSHRGLQSENGFGEGRIPYIPPFLYYTRRGIGLVTLSVHCTIYHDCPWHSLTPIGSALCVRIFSSKQLTYDGLRRNNRTRRKGLKSLSRKGLTSLSEKALKSLSRKGLKSPSRKGLNH